MVHKTIDRWVSIFRLRVTHLKQLPLGELNVNLNVERDLCTPTKVMSFAAICCCFHWHGYYSWSMGGCQGAPGMTHKWFPSAGAETTSAQQVRQSGGHLQSAQELAQSGDDCYAFGLLMSHSHNRIGGNVKMTQKFKKINFLVIGKSPFKNEYYFNMFGYFAKFRYFKVYF